jgi:hypothetical protein
VPSYDLGELAGALLAGPLREPDVEAVADLQNITAIQGTRGLDTLDVPVQVRAPTRQRAPRPACSPPRDARGRHIDSSRPPCLDEHGVRELVVGVEDKDFQAAGFERSDVAGVLLACLLVVGLPKRRGHYAAGDGFRDALDYGLRKQACTSFVRRHFLDGLAV